MCVLLRLPSLFPFLYLALFYRENTDDDRENSDSTPRLQKVLFLKIAFLKKLSPFLKRLAQYLTKFTHFEVYFAVPPAKFSRLYTLHFTPYTRKIALKCDFSCISANFIVPLHREPALGMSVHQWRRVADIIKRRLLTLCSDVLKLRNFHFSIRT
jgi:hypothetical protein